jgi:hypothetical protein
MGERVSTIRISEANKLLSLWNSIKYEGPPTSERHEIGTPLDLRRMCEDEQINVSIKTILTYFLFDFKGFCDTLAFLDKNMILFCYNLPSYKWQPG